MVAILPRPRFAAWVLANINYGRFGVLLDIALSPFYTLGFLQSHQVENGAYPIVLLHPT